MEAKRPASDSRRLEWQEVNDCTWRLIDPDASQLRLAASHGQWGGYEYPKALAYVFDAGLTERDWRIRVRLRGNQWRDWGCVIDLATAKRIAQDTVENPTAPKPAKFGVPLNLLGGERWSSDAPTLDPQTCSYVLDAEVGAVRVDWPDELPSPSDDDESM